MQWPFGHGLTYSTQTFGLSWVGAALTASVTNAGRASDAVLLVYMRPGAKSPPIPQSAPAHALKRWLVRFARVGPLRDREDADVRFEVTPEMATLVDADGNKKLYAGCYELTVEGGESTVEVTCNAQGCSVGCD